MHLAIFATVLAVASALPVPQLYCDQVHIRPGFGPGPACTPRPNALNPKNLPLCSEVAQPPGFGPGPECFNPEAAQKLNELANTPDPQNPKNLPLCSTVAQPPGFGPGPACYDPALAQKVGSLKE